MFTIPYLLFIVYSIEIQYIVSLFTLYNILFIEFNSDLIPNPRINRFKKMHYCDSVSIV